MKVWTTTELQTNLHIAGYAENYGESRQRSITTDPFKSREVSEDFTFAVAGLHLYS